MNPSGSPLDTSWENACVHRSGRCRRRVRAGSADVRRRGRAAPWGVGGGEAHHRGHGGGQGGESWADTRGLTTPAEVTRPALEAYQRHLFHLRTPTGRPLSFRSQRGRLTTVRMFFRWLTRSNVILANPASELEMPRMEKRLPRNVLTSEEAERVIAIPDIHDPIGLRDRAILEVLYSCGLRRAEVCKLRVVEASRGCRVGSPEGGSARPDRHVDRG